MPYNGGRNTGGCDSSDHENGGHNFGGYNVGSYKNGGYDCGGYVKSPCRGYTRYSCSIHSPHQTNTTKNNTIIVKVEVI